jgi:hypothetical protein
MKNQALITILAVSLLLTMTPKVGWSFECQEHQDDFNGTHSISVKTEMSLSKNPAITVIDYAKVGGNGRLAILFLFAFDDWKFLGEEVFDSNQTKLGPLLTDRKALRGGRVREVDKGYLEANKKNGLKMRIYGKQGNEDVSVSGEMIRDFLGCFSGT